MPYLGNEPAVAYTSTTKDSFSGDASTTDFTMSKSANVNAVRVVVENVVQNPTVAYTCSGTTLSFTSAPPTGTSNIYVVHLGPPAATVAPPTTINNATTFTGGVTLKNETPEDTDGGRESIVTFQGTQSGSEISTLAQIQASHDATADDQKGDLIFKTNDGSDGTSPTEAMRIDSAQNIAIGTNAPTTFSGFKTLHFKNGSGDAISLVESDGGVISQEISSDSTGVSIGSRSNHDLRITHNDTERVRLNQNGAMFFCTDFNPTTAGVRLEVDGDSYFTADGSNGRVIYVNRLGSVGIMQEFIDRGTKAGDIGTRAGNLNIGSGDVGLEFHLGDNTIYPGKSGDDAYALTDGFCNLGSGSYRFATIFASVGSINTSDENQKQQIASLTNAEITAATAISKLFKTYKWNDAVKAKGDSARTHTGVIAQQVEKALTDAGLDASKYGFWCSDTVYEVFTEMPATEANEAKQIPAKEAYTKVEHYNSKEEAPEGAVERTTKGIRYAELLSFVGAATEQRLTSIESRLTALEAG